MNKKLVKTIIAMIAILILLLLVGRCAPGSKYETRYAVAPAVAAALISGAAALTGAGINFGLNAYQNKKNQENWEKQNEYNAPIEQMARYRAAGLNANLIYGTGSASAGNAGSIAPYQNQRFDSSDLLNAVSAVQNIRMMESQVKKNMAEASIAEHDSNMRAIDAATYSEMRHYNLEKARLDNLYQIGAIDKQTYEKAKVQKQIDEILANTELSKANKRLANANIGLVGEKTKNLEWDTKTREWKYGKLEDLYNMDYTYNQDRNFIMQQTREHYPSMLRLNAGKAILGQTLIPLLQTGSMISKFL